MRRCSLLLAVTAVGSLAGCGLIINTARNAINEPIQAVDNLCLQIRCIRWAKEAWKRYAACHPDVPFTDTFAYGFRDGYVDYLWYGGTGDAPAYPRRRYTRKDYASYGGYLAIEEWYAGWRAGAAEAIASGRRNLLVVPVNLPLPPGTGPNQTGVDAASLPTTPPAEESPPPRPVPAPAPTPPGPPVYPASAGPPANPPPAVSRR